MDWFVSYVAPFGVLLPIIAALIYYKYLRRPQKVIFYYLLYSGLSNALSIYLAKVLHQTSVIIFTVSSIIWFALISYFYVLLFKGRAKKTIYPLIIIITLLTIGNLLWYQSTKVFNSYSTSLIAIIIIVYAMIYIYRQNITGIEISWASSSVNWINAGFLLYYSTALVMYISYSFIITRAFGDWVWGIHNIVLIIMYILFVIGFKKCKA